MTQSALDFTVPQTFHADSLDGAIYALFLQRGLEREIHFSELAKVGGLGGWRTRVSTARKQFRREGYDIKNRQERVTVPGGETITHSYYRLVKVG